MQNIRLFSNGAEHLVAQQAKLSQKPGVGLALMTLRSDPQIHL